MERIVEEDVEKAREKKERICKKKNAKENKKYKRIKKEDRKD